MSVRVLDDEAGDGLILDVLCCILGLSIRDVRTSLARNSFVYICWTNA